MQAKPIAVPGLGGPIVWRIHLRSSPGRVWAVLDSAHGRASFWAEEARERDGAIHFRFVDGSRQSARILHREPPHRLSIEYFGGPATFRLEACDGGGTDLTLTHDGVPSDEWLETFAGWSNVLLPLKASVDHGIDLRNHDPSRTWGDRYLDQ